MDSKFLKLAQKIHFQIRPNFENVKILSAKLNHDQKFLIKFSTLKIIPLEEMVNFYDCLNHNFDYPVQIEFKVQKETLDLLNLKNYLRWIIGDLLKQIHLAQLIYHSSMKLLNNELQITIDNQKIYQDFNPIKNQLELYLKKFGFKSIIIKTKYFEPSGDLLNAERKEHLNQVSKALKGQESVLVNDHFNQSQSFYAKTKYQKTPLTKLKDNLNPYVSVEGQIFNINLKTTSKNELVVAEIGISDYQEAVLVKQFLNNASIANTFRSRFKVGDYINVEGAYQFDGYKKDMVILAKKINISKNPLIKRKDQASQKRVELSLRTKMSTMDGVVNPIEVVKHLEELDQEAIAIVDSNSVQSFPDFHNAVKNTKIKPIYGATLNVIDPSSQVIKNITNFNTLLKTNTYIVFDLETTGLSPIFNQIIEFGAAKIVGGKVDDAIQFFVKPTQKIPPHITQLTNITDQDVENAISQKEAIIKILKFMEDFPIVAHNATFDIGFIEENMARYNLGSLKNTIIDTLIVARIIDQKSKKYRLQNYAKRLGIEYDVNKAHRADYDAKILAWAWIRSISILNDLKIETFGDLNDYHSNFLYQKKYAYEVSILVKNQNGLKKLFELISKANTTNYFNGPKLFWSDLKNQNDLLLGSGALNSHLVNKILFGTTQQIKEEIKRYDYIEIQPPQNFSHLIKEEFKLEQIEKLLKFLIQESLNQNKIVVATGDCRYLEPYQKIFYEVYIHSKGLGGERHYLYKYKMKNAKLPQQHLLTTSEMKEAFSFLNDSQLIEKIVVTNSQKINALIERVKVIKDKFYPPSFKDAHLNLKELVFANARQQYGQNLPSIVEERLEKEFKPIEKFGYSIIYWISHLLVTKSLQDGYLVGSRGSVGSSLVATMAKITEVNPLIPHYYCLKCKYNHFPQNLDLNSGYDLPNKKCPKCLINLQKDGQNIPFETFLGFEGNKVPDIDLNFSGDYQATIHEEVKKLFGEFHSFRAGTISTVAERTAFGFVKNWEAETNQIISDTFRGFLVKHLIGTKRTTGQHPGGIIIIPKKYKVEDFTPINFPANDINSSWKTTHFDFHAIHDNVVKLDLLGHDDPTAIKNLEKITNVNAKDIPMFDKSVISLFSSSQELGITPQDINGEKTGVMGVPEFGTKFVRTMLKVVNVKTFGDLISISGLSHGTDVWTNNAELLIKNKGLTLEQLISCRDDIMNDLIRKKIDAIEAFKIMEQVRKGLSITPTQEELLIKHKIPDWYILSLKKIKYMFPKAHATAYVMMAWRIAWFKLYHPLAYYATYFSTRADVIEIESLIYGKNAVEQRLKTLIQNRYKKGDNSLSNKEQALIPILEIANEAYARGINFKNIDLEYSLALDWVIDDQNKTLIAPFIAIDGLGIAAAKSIVEARQQQAFSSQEDLKKRTSINKTIFEKMKKMGILEKLVNVSQISFNFQI